MRHTITISFDLDGTPEEQIAAREEISSNAKSDMVECFGPEAFGGWDGPTVTNAEVVQGLG
jgi:hypothetical protein